MWTAQTYLGAHVSRAKYFLYLLVEDYRSEQRGFSDVVVENLRQLGLRTGHSSAIFVPDDCARDCIRQELHDLFTDHLMKKIQGSTPGILFTDKNLSDLDPETDRWVFISLQPFIEKTSEQNLGDFFDSLQTAIEKSEDLLDEITSPKWQSFWDEAKRRFMFDPNFYGVGIRGKTDRSKVVISSNMD